MTEKARHWDFFMIKSVYVRTYFNLGGRAKPRLILTILVTIDLFHEKKKKSEQ